MSPRTRPLQAHKTAGYSGPSTGSRRPGEAILEALARDQRPCLTCTRPPRQGGATATDQAHDRRDEPATVPEAARRLGITEGAVRKRVERGKLQAERDPAGRLIVYLDSDTTTTDTTRDSRGRSHDTDQGERYTRSLEDQVAYLRGQLDQERTASAELRRIVAGLTQRIPEIEAAPARDEPRESPENVFPTRTPTDDAGEPETQAQRVPWWRRMFGG